MIGKQVIEITANDLLDGMTSSPETTDGGFSPETNAVNILSSGKIGVLYQTPAVTDSSTNLNGYIIATTTDPDSGIGINNYAVTTTGRFISIDSNGALTVRRTSAGAKTYSSEQTDVVVYRNELFATSTNDVTNATGANLVSSFDESWWDTTKAKSALSTGVPHPLLVFEDSLWIGDGNKLHKWDGTTASEAFLTLPTGQVIIALGVDPSSGKMLISVSEGPNGSDALPRVAKILVYDGFSNKPSRAIIVDEMVTVIYPVGGTVFMAYGVNLGYWNGSGISFLRKLRGVTYSSTGSTTLVYKQRITNIGRSLFVADGIDILVFTETVAGKKRFFVNHRIIDSLQDYLYSIFNIGGGRLGISYQESGGTAKFAYYSTSSRGTGYLYFVSKKYTLPRPMFVREIVIEYDDAVANNTTPAVLTLKDGKKATIATSPTLLNDSGSSVYEMKVKYNGPVKFRTLQLIYDNSSSTTVIAGVRRFIIYCDTGE